MPTHLDRSSFIGPGLTHADSTLCCSVSTASVRRPSPTANFSVPLSHSLTGVSFLLPVTPRSQVQNPFSGFAPKQTKESSAWRTTYIVLQPTRLVKKHVVECILKIIQILDVTDIKCEMLRNHFSLYRSVNIIMEYSNERKLTELCVVQLLLNIIKILSLETCNCWEESSVVLWLKCRTATP